MSAVRYSITLKAVGDGVREFYVHVGTVIASPYYVPVVWVGSDGVPRCVKCSGPLVAMRASCPHAKAVKRFLKKDGGGR